MAGCPGRVPNATWIFHTPAAENRMPTKAVIALTHFHSTDTLKSINRIPNANSVSRMMGNDISYSVPVKNCDRLPGTYSFLLDGSGASDITAVAAPAPLTGRAEAST